MCFQYFSSKTIFIINLLELLCNFIANRQVAALTPSAGLNLLMKHQDKENVMFCFVFPHFTPIIMDGISSLFGGPGAQTLDVK